MKLPLTLRNVNLGLVVLLILVMGTQLGIDVRLGATAFPITIADVVLALAFVGMVLSLVHRGLRNVKLPPIQAFVLVAVALLVLARSQAKLAAAKEVLQLIEYFLIAFTVFLNVGGTSDLKLFLWAFAIATAVVVAWAGVQYAVVGSPLDVRAGFANRNVLGAFLVLALPMLYGVALHARYWSERIVLLAIVAGGLLVTLSGGAFLAIVLVLLLLSALHGRRALVPFLAVAALVALAVPHLPLRQYHTDALFSAISPYVSDNFLLSDRQMLARAEELHTKASKTMAENRATGATVAPQALYEARQAFAFLEKRQLLAEAERPLAESVAAKLEAVKEAYPPRALFDAKGLLDLLALRQGGARGLVGEEEALGRQIEADIARTADCFPEAERTSALGHGHVAVRYQRWAAAIACARALGESLPDALLGRGFVDYHAAIDPFRPEQKLQYFSNEPEVYNVATSEPFTHNVWLKAVVQTGILGLVALAWLVAALVGRAGRLHGAAHSELALGVAFGALGSVLGFALVGLFTENLGRGLAIPFVFVCSVVIIAEQIVHGEGKSALGKLTRDD